MNLPSDKSREEIIEVIGNYDVLLIHLEIQLYKEMIYRKENLKLIGKNGILLNHIGV